MKRTTGESTAIDWSKVNWDSVDDCALALIYFGRHEEYRTWKGIDWGIMNRLHAKGYISDPVGKAKSVVFTEDGLARSAALVRTQFLEP
jgi:hypothetical protein